MQDFVRAHVRVPPHGFACEHESLNNRLELGAVLCTGACAISIYGTPQRAASRSVYKLRYPKFNIKMDAADVRVCHHTAVHVCTKISKTT